MKTKWIAKFMLLVHIGAGLAMVIMALYDSFSQHATSPIGDKFLRLYLSSAQWVFLTLAIGSVAASKRIHMGWAKIRLWQIFIFIAFSFLGISITNVVDYSLADPNMTDSTKVLFHYIFTGLGAAASTFLAWHYYPRYTDDGKPNKERKLAITACIVGAGAFAFSVIFTKLGFSFLSIALGEFIISLMISFVVWPIINEQLD